MAVPPFDHRAKKTVHLYGFLGAKNPVGKGPCPFRFLSRGPLRAGR